MVNYTERYKKIYKTTFNNLVDIFNFNINKDEYVIFLEFIKFVDDYPTSTNIMAFHHAVANFVHILLCGMYSCEYLYKPIGFSESHLCRELYINKSFGNSIFPNEIPANLPFNIEHDVSFNLSQDQICQ
jgi:hypothetical protein